MPAEREANRPVARHDLGPPMLEATPAPRSRSRSGSPAAANQSAARRLLPASERREFAREHQVVPIEPRAAHVVRDVVEWPRCVCELDVAGQFSFRLPRSSEKSRVKVAGAGRMGSLVLSGDFLMALGGEGTRGARFHGRRALTVSCVVQKLKANELPRKSPRTQWARNG